MCFMGTQRGQQEKREKVRKTKLLTVIQVMASLQLHYDEPTTSTLEPSSADVGSGDVAQTGRTWEKPQQAV